MAVSGHAAPLAERRFNNGLQYLPSGRSAFPVPRNSENHRSINQRLPELWGDCSDRGLPAARRGPEQFSVSFHGDSPEKAPHSAKPGRVVFVGYAQVDVDGRSHTAGEMDRLLVHAAASKYPCSRPATFDEYAERVIMGIPERNLSGQDIVFIGPGATGCELYHTNTLGSQKCSVPPGDIFDGTWGTATLYGRKAVLCVYPEARMRRQQSLSQFGLARSTIGESGRLKRAGSLAGLTDRTRWTKGSIADVTARSQMQKSASTGGFWGSMECR